MIKGVIFDFDGVIVESTDIKTEAFAKLFEAEGRDVVEKVVFYHKNNMGVSRFEKFRYIYSDILHRRLDEDKFSALCRQFASEVVDSVIAAPFVLGAKEFLQRNLLLYSFFIMSATPQDEINDIVQRRELDRFFKSVYGAPLAKYDAVKMILQKEGLAPGEVVYLGDAMSDYLAAKDNNVKFIARIKDNEDIFRKVDCLKIANFLELPAILNTI